MGQSTQGEKLSLSLDRIDEKKLSRMTSLTTKQHNLQGAENGPRFVSAEWVEMNVEMGPDRIRAA